MDARDAPWSFREAARVFAHTIRGDLGGFDQKRKNLLANPAITQHRFKGIGYLAAGDKDDTPVIFFHGSPGGVHEWHAFLEAHQEHFRIIALDRPGYGLSSARVPDLAADIKDLGGLVEHLTARHKAILVGHSLGGGLITALAAAHPDKVQGLVFVGASLDPALEKIQPIQKLFANPRFSKFLSRSIRHSNRELIEYASGFLAGVDVSRVTAPVVAVHSHDDGLVSFKNTDFIREKFTNAESVTVMPLNSGGHFLGETQPDALWRAIELFL